MAWRRMQMNIKPAQLTLPIDIDESLSFDNFVEGANTRLVQHLKDQLASRLNDEPSPYCGIVIWGNSNVGKTHLLRALVRLFKESGGEVRWLTQEKLRLEPKAEKDAKLLYLLDDLEGFIKNNEVERVLLTTIERIKQEQALLLITARQAVSRLTLELADLSSRIKAMDSFELSMLEDAQKRQVVRQRAFQRGIVLSEAVLDWLFNHTSRELGVLLDLLEQMDVTSLTQKRRVTIPLIKAILAAQ